MFACVTGALVCIDSIGILIAPREVPPHSPKKNAVSWASGAGITTFCAFVYVWLGTYGQGAAQQLINQLITILLWFGWGAVFTYRAASRAFRPTLVLWSSFMMFAGGLILALLYPTGI